MAVDQISAQGSSTAPVYLSSIRINPLRSTSRKLLASPRAMHGAVMGGIAGDPTAARPLWRLDAPNRYRPTLLVLTSAKPDWTHIVEQAGWPDADGDHYTLLDYTPSLSDLTDAQEYAFRVTVNPVRNVPPPAPPTADHPAQRRGTRTARTTANDQLAWFSDRAPGWGFHPLDARIVSSKRHSFTKNGRGTPVTLTTVTIEGRLRVTQHNVLARALRNGLGPAKAYGCGLLTISRVSRFSRSRCM